MEFSGRASIKVKLSKQLHKILYPALLAGIVTAIYLLPGALKINSVECQSQFGPCSNPVSEKLAGLKGKTLKETKKQISTYLSTEASIKDFSVRLKLPATVLVTILEKKPRFSLKAVNEEIYAAVGADGEVLSIGQESSLPFIVMLVKPPNLGEKVSEDVLFALKIQEKLYRAY